MERLHYKKNELICLLYEEDRKNFIELPSVPLDIRSEISARVYAYGKISLFGKYRYSKVPKLAKRIALAVMRAQEEFPLAIKLINKSNYKLELIFLDP